MAIPPGFAEANIRLTLTGLSRPAYVVFGLDPVSADPFAVASLVRQAWNKVGSVNTKLDTAVLSGPFTVRIGQDGGEATVGSDDQTALGGASLSCPPPNVALLIHKRTSRGGRRGRGRMFLPWCLAEANIDEAGVIAQGDLTSMNTALEVFRADLAAAQAPMVVLHEPGRTSPGVPDVVNSLVCDRLVATQRRRLGR